MRVLVVEDELKVADALSEGLEGEKYDVVVERTGEGAFFRVTTETFDVILLDLGLPGRSGLEILTALRERGLEVDVVDTTDPDAIRADGDRTRGAMNATPAAVDGPVSPQRVSGRVSARPRPRGSA